MMRIVARARRSDNDESDNDERYQRAVARAQRGLAEAIAAQLPADASFADQERAVLAAANEACRLLLEATLHTTAAAHPIGCGLTASSTPGTRTARGRITACVGRCRCGVRPIARWVCAMDPRSCRWSWRPA